MESAGVSGQMNLLRDVIKEGLEMVIKERNLNANNINIEKEIEVVEKNIVVNYDMDIAENQVEIFVTGVFHKALKDWGCSKVNN